MFDFKKNNAIRGIGIPIIQERNILTSFISSPVMKEKRSIKFVRNVGFARI
jgi:hypothetical protein